TEGVLKTMVLNKFKTVTLLLVVGSLIAVGGGVLAHHAAQVPQTKVEKATGGGDRGDASPARTDDARAEEKEQNQADGGHKDAESIKQKVAELMRQFHECYKEGKYQEAKKAALQALELDPDNPAIVAAVQIVSVQLAQQEMARELDRRELLETIRRLGE